MTECTFAHATPDRWPDIEALFSPCAEARRCWCAFWYRPKHEFLAGRGEGNRRFLEQMIACDRSPGIIAYRDGAPAGWCGVAPRQGQVRLAASRTLAPVDDAPVWSITCFVIGKTHRRQGLMRPLIEAAVTHAAAHGATVVEAYPIDPQRKLASGEIHTGLVSAFRDLGFQEVARRSPLRPIMRRALRPRAEQAK
ncbi:MAG: GNAT family N-acetyltransferase [Alphaproteobacteria bacterium]